MSSAAKKKKKKKKDKATRQIEKVLHPQFPNVEAYRHNTFSIRVRVIDPRFAGLNAAERDALVAPLLATLPEDIEREILLLLTLTPDETEPSNLSRYSLLNLEFEDPRPSTLL